MITLFGATGYTGKIIARILDRKGLPFRLAGRSQEKLGRLSGHLNTHPDWLVADALLPETVPALFKNTSILINCVGPFTDLGEKIVASAAVSGVHYLDTTNELGFVYRSRIYDRIAKRSKAAIVPACGFEVALADCGAALLKSNVSAAIDQVDVVYHLAGSGASRGTRLSALRSLATSWLTFQNKEWIGDAPGLKRSRFKLRSGAYSAFSFPSSESVTLVSHIKPKYINTWMTTSETLSYLAPIFLPIFSRFLRSLPGRSILWAAGLRGSGSDETIRAKDPFEVYIRIQQRERPFECSVVGVNPYHITAEIIAHAAQSLHENHHSHSGTLSPSEVLDPALFFSAAQQWGVRLYGDIPTSLTKPEGDE